MSDIPVPQARYALLRENDRKRCLCQSRLLLITLILAVVTFFVSTVYVATIGIYERVVFPTSGASKDIPNQWIYRAIVYNKIDKITLNKTEDINLKTNPSYVESFKLVCYYSFPNDIDSQKYNSSGILLGENIDANLCTHINVGFATVVNNSIYLDSFQLNVSKNVIALKKINSNLKVLLSVGGAGSGSGFPEMVQNHQNRKTFIKSIDDFVLQHKFDGIDLDWEFPNEHNHVDGKQKTHFTQLLIEIRKEINRQRKHKFLLSVAVAAPYFIVANSYDIPYMNENVDYVNLMSYDYYFYTQLTPFTGINSPLYSHPNDLGYFATTNINYSANYWIEKGMDRRKIIIGLPTYGHSFRLINSKNNGLKAPAFGYGKLGSNGFVDYNDICWFIVKNKLTPIFDMDSRSPYVTKYLEWVSFDDTHSLTYKAEYIKNNNFGGAMVLSLNTDDHKGLCKQTVAGKVAFPLTNQIKTILNDQDL